MSNLLSKLWPLLLTIYIISPFDAHPLFLDDLIASAALFYLIYKNSRKTRYNHQSTHNRNDREQARASSSSSAMTLDDAYKTLGVKTGASLDEISRAYKEKVIMSHPDKVSHLSEELQEKAKELTLKLNNAYELIKQSRK